MTAQISQRQYPTYGPNVAQSSPTTADLLTSAITFIEPITAAPFSAIQSLFHHLAQDPATAAALNEVYTTRGIFKSAATINPTCDQKFTIDLSPTRTARIDGLHVSLVVSEFLCTAMREGDNHKVVLV
ncbi:Clavaminate synthase-like protein [Venturia nashicola]|uniref:Clavaminate synthase-like protein n=1 Tax=Venturia nashicola TaxID=86259 RepID=A0A4Z1NC14_9PEZI|nr:Clavaminate synthase-like protein [Venturia nashicola]